MQELLEILAGQVHRTLVQQHPEALWELRTRAVPYQELTEDQKAYEREAARETLQQLVAEGWRIEPPHTPEADLASYRERGEDYLKQGESLLAYDALSLGLRDYPGDLFLRQLQALALIRSGAPRKAQELLSTLLQEGHRDQGTLAPLARSHKDLAERTDDPLLKRTHLELACGLFTEAYRLNHGMWSGINAATLSLLLGRWEEAEILALEVESRGRDMQEALLSEGKDPFWVAPILGQAALLRGEREEALELYALAVQLGRDRPADLAEVRHNALMLLRHLDRDARAFEDVLPLTRVVVFSGHMVDHADRAAPRFPPALEGQVAQALRARLEELRAGAGFATAACGSALLFHEAILARHGESHVVLPYDREEFLKDSVAIRPDQDWSGRFDAVLAEARRVITASPQRLDRGSVPFQYANQVLLGLARLRARQMHTELVPLAVWDGQPSGVPGTTAWTVERWRDLGLRVEVIRIGDEGGGSATTRPLRAPQALPGGLEPRIMVMLFADVVNFSALQETQVPLFVAHFLTVIRDLKQALATPPRMENTWGDGLFLAFEGLSEAARFAQDLVKRVKHADWEALGLPPGLNLRVALHAGPVYVGTDPVTGRPTCFGTHVNKAARIEPITPPGQVYASQAFAALAAAEDARGLQCEYVGQLPLAKGFGTFPMYLLRVVEETPVWGGGAGESAAEPGPQGRLKP
jgi:class 3 adenylate cyclase/tetratricopeptide (TPR) repeat protein